MSIRVPLSRVPGLSRFVLDWLAGDGNATQFLPRDVNVAPATSPAEPRHAAEVGGATSRAEVADALIESNKRWGSFVSDDVHSWASGESIAIVAGQQVGFAGGPMYTLAKIATLIRLKRNFEAAGRKATIFFWLATEDHDFNEVASLQLPVAGANKQRDLVTLRAAKSIESKAAVGNMPIPEALIAELLAVMPMDRPQWLREGITFRDSFAELIATVFDEKIVLVDALLPELRRAGAPLFESLFARWSDVQRAVADRSHAIEAAGYKPQVIPPRPGDPYTLLFRLDDRANRIAIDHPEPLGDAATISTSALTRPLLQDAVIRPDVFVGGPAEVAYYAQILPLHDLLGIRAPRVMLRGHAMVAQRRVIRYLERFAIDPAEVFRNPDEILVEREPEGVAEIRRLAKEAHDALAEKMTAIGELALPADHSLARAISRSTGHIEYHFDKLTERAVRGLVRKDRERLAAVRELVSTFYPDRIVQDRCVGWFAYWCDLGKHLVERVIDEIEPDAPVCRIVEL